MAAARGSQKKTARHGVCRNGHGRNCLKNLREARSSHSARKAAPIVNIAPTAMDVANRALASQRGNVGKITVIAVRIKKMDPTLVRQQ